MINTVEFNSDEVLDLFKRRIEVSGIREQLKEYWDTPYRWNLIREYYKSVDHIICEGDRLSPYEIGLEEYLTPIELPLWNEIRCYGLPFYMQYPVGRRFVDFGDPHMRVAIEADGKAYHSPEKDSAKNAELLAEGWRVFRIIGKDAKFHPDPLMDVAHLYGKTPYSERDSEE